MTIGLKIIGLLSILWCLHLIFGIVMQCVPIKALFEPNIPKKCINAQLGFLITELLNCALDVVLVGMPVPLVKKLHLPRRERVAVGGILLLGGL
jgi:hypothetical protein